MSDLVERALVAEDALQDCRDLLARKAVECKRQADEIERLLRDGPSIKTASGTRTMREALREQFELHQQAEARVKEQADEIERLRKDTPTASQKVWREEANRQREQALRDLVPRDAVRQLSAVLDEYRRRAERGHETPKEVRVTFYLDRQGRVIEAEIPRRFGLIETAKRP